jgi:uncharacterized protein YkwD
MRPFALVLAVLCVPTSALACVDDDALAEAASVLALEGRVDDDALRDALREVGTDLPSVRALEGDEASLALTLQRLAREGDAPLVCGRASGTRGAVALVAWRGGALELADDVLRVRLAPGFSEARVLMQDADGQTNDEPVRDGERLVIPDDLVRPVRVQLLATGPSGPRPVAERTIVEGASGAGGSLSDEARAATNVASDEDLATRIAALRALAGVGELRDNRLLREAADEHAARICREGAVRHEVDGADPEVRLRRRGIVARVVGEVAARARDEDAAFDALLASPSHRAAIVDRRFTDVGVGVARVGRNLCVVADFAAWPRFAGR